MNTRFKLPGMILGLVLLVALISMACSLSTGNLNNGAPIQIPGQNNQNQSTLAPVATEQSTLAVPTESATQSGSTTGGSGDVTSATTTPEIPQTGGQAASQPGVAPATLAQIYAKSNPGVVSILVQVSQNGQQGAGAGSGFILQKNGNGGYIVTNHHVIDGASTIVVKFYNNSTAQAKVVGDDPNADLAIISVNNLAVGAHALPLGDSNKVQVGDSVVAIGNPFALGTSMSYGIVSAVGREIPSGFTPYNIPQAIQTDAAINPGNSGGPLINMNGEVIGVDAQIQTGGSSNGNVGIGFAIPANIVKLISPSLIKNGSYAWPVLGVASPANDPLAFSAANTQAQQGALIANVDPNGPAAHAGLKPNDIVVQADNQKITSFDDLLTYIAYKKPGDKVTLTVLRNGQRGQVTVTLGTRSNQTTTQPSQ